MRRVHSLETQPFGVQLFERLAADLGRGLQLGGWSHDGKRIAFADTQGVWTRDLSAGGARLVSAAGFGVHAPVWSPDDSMLAFVVGTGNVANVAPSEILVVPTTGGVPTPITDSVHLNTSPVFTPDGRGVLFVSSRSGGRDVFEQLLQGRAARGAPVRLTTGANATSLSLSADGKTLVYAAEVMRSNIWSAPIASAERAPARELRQVTFGDQEIECISVSRDGSWLLYDSNKSGNQDIYKIPVAGGEPIQLTTDLADDFCGMTSPDGREIAFYSFRPDGNRRVYTMLADGGRQQPALDGGARDQQWAPDWSPDGRQLAFTSSATGTRHITSYLAMSTAAGATAET